MSDELVFASENEAIQHLSDITGKKIKIANTESLLDEIKSIKVTSAEGKMGDIEGKEFKSIDDIQKEIAKIQKPSLGYDKTRMIITLNDGSELKGFRYDHGERDDRFLEQLKYYLKEYVSFED